MGLILFAALIGVPLLEIAVFIQVGGLIGGWLTIGLVLFTAVLGAGLLRRQGLSTIARIQEEIEQSRLPVQALFDGACLLFAGALLLTPGFVTDIVGFLLLAPPARNVLRRLIWAHLQRRGGANIAGGGWTGSPGPGDRNDRDRNRDDARVIDGDFHEVSEDERGPQSPTKSEANHH